MGDAEVKEELERVADGLNEAEEQNKRLNKLLTDKSTVNANLLSEKIKMTKELNMIKNKKEKDERLMDEMKELYRQCKKDEEVKERLIIEITQFLHFLSDFNDKSL